MGTRPLHREDLFWLKVFKTPGQGCWLWTGSRQARHGYGTFWDGTTAQLAHRYSFMLHGGEVPEGFVLDHLCQVMHCVRPDHLRVVTTKQNNEHLVVHRVNNTSGHRGVYPQPSGRWAAQVRHHGRSHYRSFDTAEQAAEWAKAKRLELFTHNEGDK